VLAGLLDSSMPPLRALLCERLKIFRGAEEVVRPGMDLPQKAGFECWKVGLEDDESTNSLCTVSGLKHFSIIKYERAQEIVRAPRNAMVET
jgi:hypothetical protein